MKNLLIMASVLLGTSAVAQTPEDTQPNGSAPTVHLNVVKPADTDPVYSTAGLDVQPEFPGGLAGFKEYFTKSYNLAGTRGKIIATFTVEKDGELTDIKILRDIGPASGKEAVRILKASPKWKPGEQNGKAIRTMVAVPFIIEGK